jgi:hypothetical protein
MNLKTIAFAAAAAVAATGAGSASATTLEIDGVTQSKAVSFEASNTGGTAFAKTDGTEANTCSESSLKGTTSVFSGAKITGSLTTLSFKKCTNESVVVDALGGFYIEWESATTSGTFFSENAKWTWPTSFGFSVTCETGTGTRLGTLDGAGSGSGHATITINALVNCGFLLPSALWKGVYKISSPTGLGVAS